MHIDFDNTYCDLPDRFYAEVAPAGFDDPEIIRVNEGLARRLGFDPDWLVGEEGAEFAVGNRLLEGAEPIAQAYAGHQFGRFVSRLGDGRAILLGEVVDENGERFDVQLKGAGRTPFSRRSGRCCANTSLFWRSLPTTPRGVSGVAARGFRGRDGPEAGVG